MLTIFFITQQFRLQSRKEHRMYMVDQRKLSITGHQIRDILEKKFY